MNSNLIDLEGRREREIVRAEWFNQARWPARWRRERRRRRLRAVMYAVFVVLVALAITFALVALYSCKGIGGTASNYQTPAPSPTLPPSNDLERYSEQCKQQCDALGRAMQMFVVTDGKMTKCQCE